MSHCASLCCSKALGLQEFCRQTQEQLQARREVQPDRPVLDGDVTTMAVKFERSVRTHAHTHTHTHKQSKYRNSSDTFLLYVLLYLMFGKFTFLE